MIFCVNCGKRIIGRVFKAFDGTSSFNKDCCSLDCSKVVSSKYGILADEALVVNLEDIKRYIDLKNSGIDEDSLKEIVFEMDTNNYGFSIMDDIALNCAMSNYSNPDNLSMDEFRDAMKEINDYLGYTG